MPTLPYRTDIRNRCAAVVSANHESPGLHADDDGVVVYVHGAGKDRDVIAWQIAMLEWIALRLNNEPTVIHPTDFALDLLNGCVP